MLYINKQQVFLSLYKGLQNRMAGIFEKTHKRFQRVPKVLNIKNRGIHRRPLNENMSINLGIGVKLFYQDLTELCKNAEHIHPKKFYTSMRRLFFLALDDCTKNVGIAFAGPFAKMDYLYKERHLPQRTYRALKHFRAKIKAISEIDEEELRRTQMLDCRLLAEFFSGIYQKGIPSELLNRLPETFEEHTSLVERALSDCIRVSVNGWDERFIYANRNDEEEEEITICYAFSEEEKEEFKLAGDLSGIRPILSKDCQINLIRPKLKEEVYYPEFIIYEPDFLIDISSVAECFEEYGLTPYTYLIRRLKPKQNTQPILIGNLAGQFLDEAVYNKTPSSYKESAVRFFRQNALNLITCPTFDSNEFHKEAQRQQRNMAAYTQMQLDGQQIFDPEKTLLEPSFFCEMLGIQGRMDLLHEDKRLLIEQKSGKWGFPNGGHQEKHYVQMLFYLAWIKYNQGIPTDHVNALLLYSKYPTEGKSFREENGLIKEGPAPKLLFNALMLRNYIAHLEMLLLKGNIKMLEQITADTLNVNEKKGVLWENYQRPEIESILQTVQKAEPTEKAYFYRFFTFLEREYHLSKNGFAQAWNTSMEEKVQDGSVYFNLELQDTIKGDANEGIESVRFAIHEEAKDNLPNFRKGDIVVCYAYHNSDQANLCHDIVFRATLTEISKDFLTVKLRATQRNENVFKKRQGFSWAMEHDFLDSSFSSGFKDLFAFLAMKNEGRKQLILNQRQPDVDKTQTLIGSYGNFNELVLKAKQAKDYFLVIGPPGTGKTSFALTNILKETLANPKASVLLASFTNRAVEEICSKLIKEEIDFIRLGHEHSCSESFDTSYLSKNKLASFTNVNEIKAQLQQNRVYVGTTASLAANSNLFDIKHFDLAIIDEASQILEPQLIGLLSAGNGNAIRKFVFIGDHKQLPAVVQQSENESEVKSETLRSIGLTNCRNSLFERLLALQKGNDELVYLLNHQGRMHPDVSEYINQQYYANLLTSVPLKHQLKDLFFNEIEKISIINDLDGILSHQRLLFFDVASKEDGTADNVNLAEAELITQLTQHIWRLYQTSGKRFMAAESIGIIVPYRAQIATIRQKLEQLGIDELKEVTVDTVERYQGSEREVIIYGTTIRHHSQLDFLAGNVFDEEGKQIDRKLNVAITRSKEMMIMVGNRQLLQGALSYHHFIQYLEGKGAIRESDTIPQ